MIEVLFFARIRERLESASTQVPYSKEVDTLAGLLGWLAREKGANWAEVLGEDNVVCAVNQEVAAPEHRLSDGDEVAFFPPVTGG
jgi:molybdopterin synthase sulfur carrier subunit